VPQKPARMCSNPFFFHNVKLTSLSFFHFPLRFSLDVSFFFPLPPSPPSGANSDLPFESFLPFEYEIFAVTLFTQLFFIYLSGRSSWTLRFLLWTPSGDNDLWSTFPFFLFSPHPFLRDGWIDCCSFGFFFLWRPSSPVFSFFFPPLREQKNGFFFLKFFCFPFLYPLKLPLSPLLE